MRQYCCPICQKDIKNNTDCIGCDKCNKWFHFKCSNIKQSDFEIYCKEKSLDWFCTTCLKDRCNKCDIIFRIGNSISCDSCDKWYHLKCSGLDKATFDQLSNNDDENWYCRLCKNDIFPFNTIETRNLESLTFNSLIIEGYYKNKLNSTLNSFYSVVDTTVNDSNYISDYSVCKNRVKNPRTSIPCPNCKHLVHKKCSNLNPDLMFKLKRSLNLWECSHCMEDKFPFTNIENEDILSDSFNSISSCKYKSTRKLKAQPNSDLKLLLDFHSNDKDKSNFDHEFDEQFEAHHTLKLDFNYYETHEFHLLKDKFEDPFSLLHTNIRSLQHNRDNLNFLITNLEFKFDIIALSETWNYEDKKHTFLPPILEGYHDYIGTTGSSIKGGCGFYVNKNLKPKSRKDLNFKVKDEQTEIETCWIEIICDKEPNRLIGLVYRHPYKNDPKSTGLLNETLEKIKKENKNVLLTGDFNYDLLLYTKIEEISTFLNMTIQHNFQPCILEPTRIVDGNKPSLIDNIFSNSLEDIISGNLIEKISDHMPNFIIINNTKHPSKCKAVRRRCLKNFDPNNFQTDLNIHILSEISEYDDVEEAYCFFHQKFLEILNKHAPIKFLTKKEQELEHKPWITKGILKSTHVKSKLYNKFKKSKKSDIFKKYKFYRNTINSLIRKSKKQYYKKFFEENMQNAKKTWAAVNSILNRKKKNKNSDIFLNVNGTVITDQNDVCKKFNDYFINVAGNLAKKIPKPSSKFQDYLTNPNEHNFFIDESTQYEVEDIINDLGINKASDIYGISSKFAKHGGPIIAGIISILFNKSINNGIFPGALKNAKVIPIHKDDSLFEVSNYRPISLLPTFSKIFEKLMYSRISSFLTKHNILFEKQFGFRKNMSTELAVNTLLSNITNCFDKKEQGMCIFLDFAKAFDTVNHNILLKKLQYYGIRGIALDWFRSYLHNRMQCTEIGNTQSDLAFIRCGVPQGSILGPLLFLLYINDITESSQFS